MLAGKAAALIERHSMLKKCAVLTVGVSGGADSIALLHFLLGICQECGIGLKAAHLNHNLRGGESLRDEEFVWRVCGEWGVELAIKSLPIAEIASVNGLSVEECAREERYRFFREICADSTDDLNRKSGDKIATGHTLSDSVETQLLNFARGTGLKGLCGIPPIRDNIIRPLLSCTRKDVEDYCRKYNLDYITDSTNLSDDYSRNKLRHHVIPVLEEINPAFLESALHTADILTEDEYYLNLQARLLTSGLERDGSYSREGYLGLYEAMQKRILRILCAKNGIEPSARRIGLMDSVIRRGSGAVQLSADHIFTCRNSLFMIGTVKGDEGENGLRNIEVDLTKLPDDGLFQLMAGKFVKLLLVNRTEFEYLYKNNRKLLKYAVDCGKIGRIVVLRGRRPGDSIRLAGRGCTKSFKKLFNEKAVPVPERAVRIVICGTDESPVWLEGFGPAQSYYVTEDTAHILLIELLGET